MTYPEDMELLPTRVKQIRAADEHNLLLDVDGNVFAWGANDKGQLGRGDRENSDTPVKVYGLADATAIATGYAHACAARRNGSVACWGDDSLGKFTDKIEYGDDFHIEVANWQSLVDEDKEEDGP